MLDVLERSIQCASCRLRIAATISSSVKIRVVGNQRQQKVGVRLQWRELPPLGLGAMLPVSCRRCIHLIAELGLTSNHSAASRRDAPDSTARCSM